MKESTALVLLERAQQGDEDATREVALHVFNTNRHRIFALYSQDPAIGDEDLESTFFEGIVRAIGNTESYVQRWRTSGGAHPLKHVGQRGVWAVMSEIRSINASLKHRDFAPVIGEDSEPDLAERTDDDFREIVVERVGAEQTVRILANSALRGRSREAMDLILDGAVGDPTESGFNQRLARQMEVTPQRASQVMAKLREEVVGL